MLVAVAADEYFTLRREHSVFLDGVVERPEERVAFVLSSFNGGLHLCE